MKLTAAILPLLFKYLYGVSMEFSVFSTTAFVIDANILAFFLRLLCVENNRTFYFPLRLSLAVLVSRGSCL